MAFYSVRLDEEGNEIETSRRTFRKPCLDTDRKIGTSTHSHSNDPDDQLFSPATNTANNYKTVRYVNSATFIEKDLDITRKKPTAEKYKNQNYKDSDSNSSHSNWNSDEPADQRYQTHISPDAIPLLELNSNESFPSSNTMSYSYRKVCEVTKMIQKPDAYKEWLDAKRTAKYYEMKKKQDKEREEQKKRQQRRALAQQKYKEWMARKIKQQKQPNEMKTSNDPKQSKLEPNNSEEEQLAKERNFQAWLKKKLKQEKELKEKINEELKLEMRLEQIRRQKAEEIYKDWVQTAIYKPKPVPLNRGLLTLKGSVSNLYINPVSWVFLDTTEGSVNL